MIYYIFAPDSTIFFSQLWHMNYALTTGSRGNSSLLWSFTALGGTCITENSYHGITGLFSIQTASSCSSHKCTFYYTHTNCKLGVKLTNKRKNTEQQFMISRKRVSVSVYWSVYILGHSSFFLFFFCFCHGHISDFQLRSICTHREKKKIV